MLSAGHSLLPFVAIHQTAAVFQAMLHMAPTGVALHYLSAPRECRSCKIARYGPTALSAEARAASGLLGACFATRL